MRRCGSGGGLVPSSQPPTSHWDGAQGFHAVTANPKLLGPYPPRGACQEAPEGSSWQWSFSSPGAHDGHSRHGPP
eukprot:12892132-Heterocapsa_arctica.AAC.1